ncbi:flavodoxin [Achromobacter mucicolens]|uniref:flavodoxin n=1 Tax=Achromobacter mucicolens TaxID=1389922 RepID=UPI0015C6FB8A|nr:flavodoxin [Achromobacter mucicolens]MDG9967851.1 flavodoxin [Achromobacter mucicolens]
MTVDHDSTRRTVMAALVTLPLGTAATASNAQGGEMRQLGSRTLVVYFSRSGNTRVVAGLIHRARGTDLFEIRPASAYPEDYEQTVEQARKETESGYRPPLAATVPAIAGYDTVFLGFPIWGTTVPPAVRSFLSAHDLSGKALIPFITHGGYGPGNSKSVLASDAPKARLLDGLVIEMDQERRTMERVSSWLSGVPQT